MVTVAILSALVLAWGRAQHSRHEQSHHSRLHVVMPDGQKSPRPAGWIGLIPR